MKKVVLLIRDGWGVRQDKDNIYQKSEYRRVFDFWWELY